MAWPGDPESWSAAQGRMRREGGKEGCVCPRPSPCHTANRSGQSGDAHRVPTWEAPLGAQRFRFQPLVALGGGGNLVTLLAGSEHTRGQVGSGRRCLAPSRLSFTLVNREPHKGRTRLYVTAHSRRRAHSRHTVGAPYVHVGSQMAGAFPGPHSLRWLFRLVGFGTYLELTPWQDAPVFTGVSGCEWSSPQCLSGGSHQCCPAAPLFWGPTDLHFLPPCA